MQPLLQGMGSHEASNIAALLSNFGDMDDLLNSYSEPLDSAAFFGNGLHDDFGQQGPLHTGPAAVPTVLYPPQQPMLSNPALVKLEQAEHSPQLQQPQLPVKKKRGRPPGSGNPLNQISPKELELQVEAKQQLVDRLQRENELLSYKCKMLQMVVEARDENLRRFQEIQEGSVDQEHFTTALGADLKGLQQASLRELAERVRQLMLQVGQLLIDVELKGDKGPLLVLVEAVHESMKYGCLLRPDGIVLAGRDVTESSNSMEDSSVAPQSHWASLVTRLSLTPEQCRQAWVLNELYSRWQSKILSDRGVTNAALGRVLTVRRYGQIFDGSHYTDHEDEKLLEKLHNSLMRERCLMVLVMDVWRAKILDHMQFAQMIIHSHPYCFDDIAILSAAAALHAPPGALNGASRQPQPPLPAVQQHRSLAHPPGASLTAPVTGTTPSLPSLAQALDAAAQAFVTPPQQPPVLPPSPLIQLNSISLQGSQSLKHAGSASSSLPSVSAPQGGSSQNLGLAASGPLEFVPGSIVLAHALSGATSSDRVPSPHTLGHSFSRNSTSNSLGSGSVGL